MRILIVEDDERIAESLAEALTDRHYIVNTASDGEKGWEFAEVRCVSPALLIVFVSSNNLCKVIVVGGKS